LQISVLFLYNVHAGMPAMWHALYSTALYIIPKT